MSTVMGSWKTPVADPRITQTYTDALLAQDHGKPHAFDTPARFSDAMGCAAALGYSMADVERTDPMDGSSLAITGMGSLLHEDIQDANRVANPAMDFETKGILGDLVSGHIDILDPDNDEAVEIKTVGAFKFDMSIGLFRSPGRGQPPRRTTPQGPDLAHVCQAGFNARAQGRSKVRIVYISREAVAVKKARFLNMTSIDRFAAEWVIGEDVWGPLVSYELVRLETIRAEVANGYRPDRVDIETKDGIVKPVKVDIETHWRCDGYCQWAQQCRMDGPGRVKLPVKP